MLRDAHASTSALVRNRTHSAMPPGGIVNSTRSPNVRRANVITLVLSQGLRFVVIGVALGAAIAIAAARLLSSMLFGIPAHDAVTVGQVVVVVTVMAVIACGVPTARVGRLVTSAPKPE